MTTPPDGADSYPRQSARTQRYTLGEPRNVVVSPDGERIVFLRSRARHRPRQLPVGRRRRDRRGAPRRRPRGAARRARRRGPAAGGAGPAGAGPGAGRRHHGVRHRRRRDRDGVRPRRAAVRRRPAVAARPASWPSPGRCSTRGPTRTARRVAYVSGRLLRIGELDGRWRVLAGGEDDEPEAITWGSAEFVAAEEMDRIRGYWWSPDGAALAVTRVDTRPVQRWYLGDPADPATAPTEMPYPAAGTANADVTLHVVGLDGSIVDVEWDRDAFPYLADVHWSDAGLIATVQSRDQRTVRCCASTRRPAPPSVELEDHDDIWVELVAGVPALLPDGTLVTCADRDGARRLLVDGEPVTPADLQVRGVSSVGDDARRVHGQRDRRRRRRCRSGAGRPTATLDGADRRAGRARGRRRRRHRRRAHRDARRARRAVGDARRRRADEPRGDAGDARRRHASRSPASVALATAVLLPRDHDGSPLPVLLDPYGGPHGPRVVQAHNAYLASQWFADQGFAVVVADGRGTPGRGSAWERAVHHDLATPVLDDQIDGLHRAAEQHPELDLDRGRHPRLELRRVPRRARRAAPPRRVPRRRSPARRSRSGASTTPTTPSATSATRTRSPTSTTPARCSRSPPARPARCCSSTGWPTTTSSPPTRCSCPRRCSPPAGPTRCCRSSA